MGLATLSRSVVVVLALAATGLGLRLLLGPAAAKRDALELVGGDRAHLRERGDRVRDRVVLGRLVLLVVRAVDEVHLGEVLLGGVDVVVIGLVDVELLRRVLEVLVVDGVVLDGLVDRRERTRSLTGMVRSSAALATALGRLPRVRWRMSAGCRRRGGVTTACQGRHGLGPLVAHGLDDAVEVVLAGLDQDLSLVVRREGGRAQELERARRALLHLEVPLAALRLHLEELADEFDEADALGAAEGLPLLQDVAGAVNGDLVEHLHEVDDLVDAVRDRDLVEGHLLEDERTVALDRVHQVEGRLGERLVVSHAHAPRADGAQPLRVELGGLVHVVVVGGELRYCWRSSAAPLLLDARHASARAFGRRGRLLGARRAVAVGEVVVVLGLLPVAEPSWSGGGRRVHLEPVDGGGEGELRDVEDVVVESARSAPRLRSAPSSGAIGERLGCRPHGEAWAAAAGARRATKARIVATQSEHRAPLPMARPYLGTNSNA